MKIVKLNLGPRSYNIYIGKGLLNRFGSFLKPKTPDTPLFVVTNKRINLLCGKRLKKALRRTSKKVLFVEVPDSEKAKSFTVYIKTVRKLAHFAKKTKPFVIALGGGVVGDLAGFVASAYRRGVPYAQIPTTLLAQVDSSIGGKVAIDIKEAKNIVGNFYQPALVVCDLDMLKTLPDSEFRNGLVEIVKYGIIKDRALFIFIEKNLKKILSRRTKALLYIVQRCCSIKAGVVEKDELDTKDIRATLNFGHTIGHAIEAASRYSSVKHGRAVASGMVMAGEIAEKMGVLKEKEKKRMTALIENARPKNPLTGISLKRVIDALSYDKKFIYGYNRFILPQRIGYAKIVDRVPRSLIEKVIRKGLSEQPGA